MFFFLDSVKRRAPATAAAAALFCFPLLLSLFFALSSQNSPLLLLLLSLLSLLSLVSVAAAPNATYDPSKKQVIITSPEQYTVTSNPYPLFDVDFGGRVPAFDPLPLISVKGAAVAGFDVAYDLDAGRILVGVRVKPSSQAEGKKAAASADDGGGSGSGDDGGLITVSVSPGAVVDAAGRPCTGASLSLIYAAPRALRADAISVGALALTAAWGAAFRA